LLQLDSCNIDLKEYEASMKRIRRDHWALWRRIKKVTVHAASAQRRIIIAAMGRPLFSLRSSGRAWA
jgi:hypothetical protein